MNIQCEDTINHKNYFKKDDDTVLIVFIHGITGGMDTWTNKNSSFFFPEALHNDLPSHTVYIFNYESCKIKSSQEFYEIIEALNKNLELIANRYNEIIFVAHSMGGLIAKTYLVSNMQRDFFSKINKLLLLSTPNNGNSIASFVSYLSKNPQFKNLEPIQDNIFLQQLTQMWIELYGNNGTAINAIQCYCGYETETTYLKLFVPLEAVSSPCCSMIKGFKKNHISISKPLGIEDEVYIWVRNRILCELSEIEKLSKKALYQLYQTRIKLLEDENQELRNEVMKNFNRPSPNDDLLNSYIKKEAEVNILQSSYNKLIDLLENTNIEEQKLLLILKALTENNFDNALEICDEYSIDLEIQKLNNQRDQLAQIILIQIQLFFFTNNIEKIKRYYDKLFNIRKNEIDLLDYANFLKFMGTFDQAEDLYLELIRTTENIVVKAMCYNNLGTMSKELHINYANGLKYFDQAYSLYDVIYNDTKDEKYYIYSLESKINYNTLQVLSAYNHDTILENLEILHDRINTLDSSNENVGKLKFLILNNILSINIYNNKTVENLILNELKEIHDILIENQMYLYNNYAEMIAEYYSNLGAYYGTLLKDDSFNNELFTSAIKYFNKALKYRNTLIPKIPNNKKEIIKIKKNIGILYADTQDSITSYNLFIEALNEINELINLNAQNYKMYLEEKIELIICILSVSTQDTPTNSKFYLEGLNCCIVINNYNENLYDILLCRLIQVRIPTCAENADKQSLYQEAMKILSKYNTKEAKRMQELFNECKMYLQF